MHYGTSKRGDGGPGGILATTDAVARLENLTRRGVRLIPNPPKLIAEPSSLLTDEDRAAIRVHKPQLLSLLAPQPAADAIPGAPATSDDPAREALAVLVRLKGYTLPSGRMPAAHAIVERLRPLLAAPEVDTAAAFVAVQAAEADVRALGGAYEPELVDAMQTANYFFPGARLVAVRKLQ